MKVNNKYLLISIGVQLPDILLNSFLTLYLLEKGCTYGQIGILWSIYLGSCALVDYPTGGLADKFGRRFIYAIGIMFTGISYFVLYFSNLFMGLCLSYLLKGIGTSQMTGALTSWLACDSGAEVYNETLKRTKLYLSFINILIPILLLSINITNINPIVLGSGIFNIFIVIVIMVVLKENYGSGEKLKNIYIGSLKILTTKRQLWRVLFFNIVSFTFYTTFLFVWQPIAQDILPGLKFLPILFGLFSVASGIGANLVKSNKDKVNSGYIFSLLSFILSFICFELSQNINNILLLFVAMVSFGFANGAIYILNSILINIETPDEYKSSVFSLISSITTIFTFLVQIIFGFVLEKYGFNTLINTTIILCLLLLILKVQSGVARGIKK